MIKMGKQSRMLGYHESLNYFGSGLLSDLNNMLLYIIGLNNMLLNK